MADSKKQSDAWLRLSEAADYIGVHFTTLRRWADDGDVACIRTPGGRRRFKKKDLDAFLSSRRQTQHATSDRPDLMAHQSTLVKQMRHKGIRSEPWHADLGEKQRAMMAAIGRKLTALLIMYVGSNQDDQKILEEGKSLASEYSEMFIQAGLSLHDIGHAFILVRRSITDVLYETGMLTGPHNEESWTNYKRVNYFLDTMLLSILTFFSQTLSQPTMDHPSN